MTCKLRCPICGTMCKNERVDDMKEADGTYTVEWGLEDNWLTCSVCNETTSANEWDDE